MRIHGINSAYTEAERTNTNVSMDSKSKEVQSQITDAKNSLKELSADKALNEEEKEKKRQELKQKLSDLNHQLRQRQMELLREQQEKRKEALNPLQEDEDAKETKRQENGLSGTGVSQGGIKAMVSADTSVLHAQKHGYIAKSFEGRVRVLQGEIRQDEERGKDTRQKEQELKKLEEKAARMKGAKVSFLTDASKELKRASEKELRKGKKIEKAGGDGVVRQVKPPFGQSSKQKTNGYLGGGMFSNVDFHF